MSGLENGIVLFFLKLTIWYQVDCCLLRLGLGTDTLSPTEVVAVQP
jgi:hypothetical protein